ncbi:hypothetical protein BH18CHL2_BH18CHL2_06730 [soil metagenome]
MSRTRVGIVGAGFIARRHAEVLCTFEDVSLVAVADPVLERASELAAHTGARAFPGADEMLDASALDAVFICVPPFAHGAPEAATLGRGLPFLVEKPLAADLATAERVAAEVERAGVPTAAGYHWRYLTTTERAQDLLGANPPRLALGYWLDCTPEAGWWRHAELSGGQIVEQTTHVLYLARLLVGEATSVHAVASRTSRAGFADMDIADVTAATVRCATGAIGTRASTCLLRWRHRAGLHLFCDALAIELSEFDMVVDVGRGRPVTEPIGDPVAREDRDFIDAVQGRPDRSRVPYAEALRTHRLACAVARSAAEGRPIDLDPAAVASP